MCVRALYMCAVPTYIHFTFFGFRTALVRMDVGRGYSTSMGRILPMLECWLNVICV